MVGTGVRTKRWRIRRLERHWRGGGREGLQVVRVERVEAADRVRLTVESDDRDIDIELGGNGVLVVSLDRFLDPRQLLVRALSHFGVVLGAERAERGRLRGNACDREDDTDQEATC